MIFRALLIGVLVSSQVFAQLSPSADSGEISGAKSKWTSASNTPHDLFDLLKSGNTAEILKAEAEIGFTKKRVGDGRYLQQHWAVALAQFAMYHNGPAETISTNWLKEKGADTYACTLRVSVLYNQALKARGGGYAYTVSDEAAATIQSKLKEADKVLVGCGKRIRATLFWNILRLRITHFSDHLTHLRQAHFDDAIKLWPDADEIYEPALISALPVWGGSLEEVDQIIEAATKRSQPRLRTVLYARLYHNLMDQQSQLQLSDTLADWSKMKQSFADFRALKEPDMEGYMGYIKYACLRDDFAETRLLLDSIRQRYTHPSISERARDRIFGTLAMYEADPCLTKARALPSNIH